MTVNSLTDKTPRKQAGKAYEKPRGVFCDKAHALEARLRPRGPSVGGPEAPDADRTAAQDSMYLLAQVTRAAPGWTPAEFKQGLIV